MAANSDSDIAEAGMQAGALVNQAFGMVIAMTSLRAIFEIGLQEKIPIDRSISIEELSQASGADAALIVRLVRPLLALGIFRETGAAEYAHTPMSMAFMDPRLRDYMQIGWDMWLPVYGSLHTWLAKHDFQLSQDPQQTPFASYYGDALFPYLANHPAQAAVFNASMEHLAFPVATLFPFAERMSEMQSNETADGTVLIDVGGGKGQASREILTECPALAGKIVLQDQASVLAKTPEDLNGKVRPMPYNFFEPQPLKGAAFYYLRNILCDWPDVQCVHILSNQRDALTHSSARVLIAARILPDRQVDPMTAAMDICMMTYGGAERTESHFAKLAQRAGLQLVKVWKSAATAEWGVLELKKA